MEHAGVGQGRNLATAVRGGAAKVALGLLRVHHHVGRASHDVALTFDDGPDPEHTPVVLDELRRLAVLATFFLVGRRAKAHPHLVRRILDEGHALGSHSYSHPDPWTVPLRRLVGEYRQGRAHVESAAGRPVALFRPPKGFMSGGGAAAMLAARVRPWLWTIDPRDWEPDVQPAQIVAGVDGMQGGDVILLHDAIEGPLAPSALDRSATSAALPAIVALGRRRGLRFVTLPGTG